MLSRDLEDMDAAGAVTERSELHVSKVRALHTFTENQERGDEARTLTEDLRSLNREQRMAHIRHGQRQRERHVKQVEAMRRIKETLQEQNRRSAQQAKADKQGLKERQEAQDEQVRQRNRERAEAAYSLQQQLSARERTTASIARQQGAQMSSGLHRAVASTRNRELDAKRRQAATLRHSMRVGAASTHRKTSREHALRLQIQRFEAEHDRGRRQESEDEYIKSAREINDATTVHRAQTQANHRALQRARSERADQLRRLHAEVAAKQEEIADWNEEVRHDVVQELHDTRFGSMADANQYTASALNTVHRSARFRPKLALDGLKSPRRPDSEMYTWYGASFSLARCRTR